MKLYKVKAILKEHVKKASERTGRDLIAEGLLDKLLVMIMAPKVRKDADKLKKSPEYQALVAQAKQALEALDVVNKQLEQAYIERSKLEDEARQYGIKIKPYKTTDELIAQFPSHEMLKKRYKK